MFIVLYRWKLREGREDSFREGWRRRTEEIHRRCGSLGSRLHRAEDGTWIAYAQWPDRRTWEAASKITPADAEAVGMMRESVETSFPNTYMSVAEDLLKSKVFTGGG